MTDPVSRTPPKPDALSAPSRREAVRAFGRIGLLSFGGPAAQISLMHEELVDRRGWMSERGFLNALSFCMLLPGPEAMQLATYCGWRLHGTIGGLIAGLLFVLPGAAVMLALAATYHLLGAAPAVEALFLGVKAAVIVIVLQALMKVAKRALRGTSSWVIAGLAFFGIFCLGAPFPFIIAAAALYGFAFGAGEQAEEPKPLRKPSRTLGVIATWLVIWIAPLVAVGATFDKMAEIGAFFSRLAVVTFGGAYAVLAYMAQDVVATFGWLTPGEMLDGLGLAETTPGPLILVTEFVGFVAAAKEGGVWFGALGAVVALWATFAPCFLWIFAGAPYIDWIAGQPRLSGALDAITAAVVGVILNLAIWFSMHVFFGTVTPEAAGPLTLWTPELASFDWRATLLTAVAALLALKFGWGLARLLASSAALGFLLSLV